MLARLVRPIAPAEQAGIADRTSPRATRINSRTGRLPGVGAEARLLGSVDDAGQGLADAVGGLVRVGLAGYLTGGGVWNPVLAGWTYAGDLLVWGALAVSFPVASLTRSPGASSAPSLGSSAAEKARPRPGRAVPWAWTTSMPGRPCAGAGEGGTEIVL